ncbi:MAG: serine protease [Candidatus Obscuribacterales bacterium]|nr:serine protease [Candidatus Obscuribacterales bacterium]
MDSKAPEADANNGLQSEWQLIRDGLSEGFKARSRQSGEHLLGTAGEFAASFATGAALTYAMKCGGLPGKVAKLAAAGFGASMLVDVSARSKSLYDAYQSPIFESSLGQSLRKEAISESLGKGIFDYGFMLSSGALGAFAAHFGPSAFKSLSKFTAQVGDSAALSNKASLLAAASRNCLKPESQLISAPDSAAGKATALPKESKSFAALDEKVTVISNDESAAGDLSTGTNPFEVGSRRFVCELGEMADTYQRAMETVVQIWGPDSIGNGFLVSGKGLIVTDNHVVASSESWNVKTGDGVSSKARVLSRDPANDLAVLALEKKQNRSLPFLREMADAELHDDVAALSRHKRAPMQISMGTIAELTSLDRVTELPLPGESAVRPVILANYPSYPGMSGAPVLRYMDGKLVGVVNGNIKPRAAGFATPSSAVSNLLKTISSFE